MKYFKLFFYLLIIPFVLVGCSKSSNENEAINMNYSVAEELSKIENIEELDDETIKALSVVIRTNKMLNNDTVLNKDEYQAVNEHILELTKETDGQILSNTNEPLKISQTVEKEETTWKRTIKKSELLNFLNKNGISLSNLSNINPIFDDEGNLTYLSIAEKNISFDVLKEEFDLKSPTIIDIKNNISSITIIGENVETQTQVFVISNAQEMAYSGSDYKQLLKHFYEGSDLKTN